MQTHWSHPLDAFREEGFTNRKTGRPYRLVRADAVAPGPERIEQVRAICNEEPVYEILFSHIFGGKPYTAESAAGFLDWAAKGWRERTHFIFLILDEAGRICGNVDVKSPDLEGAEIGYWAAAAHAGIITPALGAVCAVARAAGYKSFFAYVVPHNGRSIQVLTANGFALDKEGVQYKGKTCDLYRRAL
ncbi:MAG: GNAT family N-acetyltransferase [Elusimicrobiales bacterium]